MSRRDVEFPVATPPGDVAVLVVGAGPVGLSAAVELAGRGVDVAVVDAATRATLVRAARAAFGFDLDLELASSTTYYQATRITATFRKGRVLLAGDAAHVRAPGGNLGEGFGDVVNLGWKLAAVLGGHGADALLDSYDHERRPHNWRVAHHALDRARRGRERLAEIRGIGVPDDADTSADAEARREEIRRLLAGERGEAPGVLFDASAVVWYEDGQLADEPPWDADRYEDDPRPGHRAPDGYVDPWGDTLFDRLGDQLALLVLTGDRAVERAFAAAARQRELPFTVVHLSDEAARRVYGTGNVLVRPDQHVAWRGTELPPGGAAAVLDRVLGHSAPTPTPTKGATHDLALR